MGSDLHKTVRLQPLTDDHVQFFIYQILRGLKVCIYQDAPNLSRVFDFISLSLFYPVYPLGWHHSQGEGQLLSQLIHLISDWFQVFVV